MGRKVKVSLLHFCELWCRSEDEPSIHQESGNPSSQLWFMPRPRSSAISALNQSPDMVLPAARCSLSPPNNHKTTQVLPRPARACSRVECGGHQLQLRRSAEHRAGPSSQG